jgi:hypothetical protein
MAPPNSRRREELRVRHHTLKIGLAVAALAVVTTGCSTPPSVGGTPTPQTTGINAEGKLPSGAPHVATPLDTTKAQAAPCSVLTAAQITSLGIVATGKPDNFTTGPLCNWHDTSAIPSPMSIGIGFISASKGGLSSLYVQADSLKKVGGYFEPIDPIQGYPAVLYSQYDDRQAKTNASCALAIGVSDELQFTVTVTVIKPTPQSDPCTIDKKAADMIMTTLKAGS